ncbi:MAG: ABC transporter permease [Anaerolineae bacterium]|nr:ABC transporter permease [Anaerolineae bacterium]
MRVIDLMLKDLLQTVRDWKTTTFLVVMPVIFTLLFGFIFGGGGGDGADLRTPVGVIDQDAGRLLSTRLLDLFEASDVVRPVLLEDGDLDGALAMVADEEIGGVVVIPAGYTDQALAGGDARLTVVADTSTGAGSTVEMGVQALASRLIGAAQTAWLSAQAFAARAEFADDAERQTFLADALDRALAAWADPPLTVAVTDARAVAVEEIYSDNSYAHSSPGMMIQFSIAGLISFAEVIVVERKSKSLRRMLTTAISRTEIILGHYLAIFVMIFVQLVILIAFGQIALGLDYLAAPLATLLLMVTMAMWTAALGLFIGVLAKTEEHAVIFAMIPMFVLSALGGAWMPLEVTPEAFQTVGHLLPTAWAIDGFKNILVRGLGVEAALLPAGIMLAYGVAFFALALWRFRFE